MKFRYFSFAVGVVIGMAGIIGWSSSPSSIDTVVGSEELQIPIHRVSVDLHNHYQGDQYDHLYGQLFNNNREAIAKEIGEILLSENTVLLVDVGGGTGDTIQRLKHYAFHGGKTPKFMLVDPFENMIQQAMKRTYPPDEIFQESGNDFATKEVYRGQIDAVLCQEMIHHIEKPFEFFKDVYNKLKPGGKILIITRPLEVDFPFGSHGKRLWKSLYKTTPDEFISLLKRAGFCVDVQNKFYPISVDKLLWLEMIDTTPIFSNISALTKQEKEEDRQEVLLRCADKKTLHFWDHQMFIIGKKTNPEPNQDL